MGEHKERPILFSGPMVRTIVEGRKTQTRRLAKYHPFLGEPSDWGHKIGAPSFERIVGDYRRFCPYGVPGDRLWVRETHYAFGHWEPVDGVQTKGGRQKWRFVQDFNEFRFDPPEDFRKGRHHKDPTTPAWHRRLARFMPRRFGRLLLEVTDVRVERLQDITEDDARAEGFEPVPVHGKWAGPRQTGGHWSARKPFVETWDSINGGIASWSDNPWVWVVNFKRAEVGHG